MLNKEYINIFSFKDNVLIYNRYTGGVVIISSFVFNIVKDVNNVDEIKQIALNYDKEDQRYFESLINACNEFKIFVYDPKQSIGRINFAITDYCNLYCTHCCYSAKLINNTTKKEEVITLDMSLIKRIIELNPRSLVITGGEPLLVTNFDEVMCYLNENYDGAISLATNATLINEQNVDLLSKGFDSFDLSLDGIDEESCDSIRGKGTFNKVINAIKLLQKNNVENIIVSMAFDNNTRNLDTQFIELCKNLNVKPKIRAMNLTGRASDNHIDSDEITKFMIGGVANITGAYDCPGGISEFFVNSKGEVYPCGLFDKDEYLIGSIFDKNILEQFKWDKNLPWFRAFSEYIPDTREECSDCEIKTFCWNCPALADSYLRNQKKSTFTDHCQLKKKQIIEAIENA